MYVKYIHRTIRYGCYSKLHLAIIIASHPNPVNRTTPHILRNIILSGMGTNIFLPMKAVAKIKLYVDEDDKF